MLVNCQERTPVIWSPFLCLSFICYGDFTSVARGVSNPALFSSSASNLSHRLHHLHDTS